MRNSIQKFRQSSIVFEKPGILSENLETFFGFFSIIFRSWVINKSVNTVTLLLITQDLNKIKKIPQIFF